ncbi:hypothetical protein CIHG_01705 [Coccidioides immitis H538.4]|uniref:Uncharacterized protein n=3 Tax=Coccidioides immitis TaxID=5501 RepID=A0A0J8R5R1_COCIT|nr:hypothetical protein CIRG_06034 [Coccidioides immitis RMSCC 2394]KMU80444.1 hypothetical protein CISG_02295 [Coccidioides immitis RMSCC 3703]KMU83921.1 hypothetical protein CIHG_01705 [Coccidioides immitis H538.4]
MAPTSQNVHLDEVVESERSGMTHAVQGGLSKRRLISLKNLRLAGRTFQPRSSLKARTRHGIFKRASDEGITDIVVPVSKLEAQSAPTTRGRFHPSIPSRGGKGGDFWGFQIELIISPSRSRCHLPRGTISKLGQELTGGIRDTLGKGRLVNYDRGSQANLGQGSGLTQDEMGDQGEAIVEAFEGDFRKSAEEPGLVHASLEADPGEETLFDPLFSRAGAG